MASVHFMLDHPHARRPTRFGLAAGYDVYAADAVVIPAGGRGVVNTGVKLAVPTGHYVRVASRSGLAVKHGVHCGAGVIDEDYRGGIGVVLFNFGRDDFVVNTGDRVAQLLFERISHPEFVQVDSLPCTERGSQGFGSSGP